MNQAIKDSITNLCKSAREKLQDLLTAPTKGDLSVAL